MSSRLVNVVMEHVFEAFGVLCLYCLIAYGFWWADLVGCIVGLGGYALIRVITWLQDAEWPEDAD